MPNGQAESAERALVIQGASSIMSSVGSSVPLSDWYKYFAPFATDIDGLGGGFQAMQVENFEGAQTLGPHVERIFHSSDGAGSLHYVHWKTPKEALHDLVTAVGLPDFAIANLERLLACPALRGKEDSF